MRAAVVIKRRLKVYNADIDAILSEALRVPLYLSRVFLRRLRDDG